MKKLILLTLVAIFTLSCSKDEEKEITIIDKTYTMEYTKGDYSEIVNVNLTMFKNSHDNINTFKSLSIKFVANGNRILRNYYLYDKTLHYYEVAADVRKKYKPDPYIESVTITEEGRFYLKDQDLSYYKEFSTNNSGDNGPIYETLFELKEVR